LVKWATADSTTISTIHAVGKAPPQVRMPSRMHSEVVEEDDLEELGSLVHA
jgi:hypothetical protein